MSDRDDFGAFFVGFFVGSISGAIAALLLAPQSGEETRTMIKDRAIELRDQASTTIEETVARAEKPHRMQLSELKPCLNRQKNVRVKLRKKAK